MEKKLTEQEAEKIERDRNLRQTKLFIEYARQLSLLPEDFRMGSELTEAMAEEHLKPIANNLYDFVRENGMTMGDIQKIDVMFKALFAYTLERAMNFTAGRLESLMYDTFGHSDIVTDMPIKDIFEKSLETGKGVDDSVE